MMLDFIGIVLIVLYFIRGYTKGVVVAVFSFLAVILGVIVSLKLSGWFAGWLLANGLVTSSVSLLLSYAILFVGVILLVRFIANAVESIFKMSLLGWLNSLMGGCMYAFMAAVVWSSLLWILHEMHAISPSTIAASKTYPYLQPLAPWIFEHIGKLLPFAKGIFEELKQFFQHIDQVIPNHVGTAR
jgi:membrane protein required for colicin V production